MARARERAKRSCLQVVRMAAHASTMDQTIIRRQNKPLLVLLRNLLQRLELLLTGEQLLQIYATQLQQDSVIV